MRELFPANVADWPTFAHHVRNGDELARWLISSWLNGSLFTVHSIGAEETVRPLLAETLAELSPDLEVEVTQAVDSDLVRRWCWIEQIVLSPQDEDLWLMSDEFVRPLLEEAQAGCPKGPYARLMVAHHLRDSAYAAVTDEPQTIRSRLQDYSTYRDLAAQTGDADLTDYLERLLTYRDRQRTPQPLALQCIRDVWRCNDPGNLTLTFRQGVYTVNDRFPTRQFTVHSATGDLTLKSKRN